VIDRVIRLPAQRFVLNNVDNDRNGPTSLPTITSDITIQGGDATVIGRNEDGPPFRIFQVASSGVLTLEGLTVTKGRAEMPGGTRTANSGGAVYNNGVLTVRRSRLIENTASRDGGAIFNINRGLSSIEESEVSANVSLIGSGGAIYAEQGVVMVQNSVLQSNDVRRRHGGGIYVDTSAQLTISRSSLLENRSAVDGGAIYSAGQSTVIASTFYGNIAAFSGGGVYVSDAMSIIDSTIAGNRTTDFSDGGGGMGTSLAGIITVSNALLFNPGGGGDCSVPIRLSVPARSYGRCRGFTVPFVSLPSPADNGGPTPTIALPPTSRAVDNGTECLPTDQRGFPRPRPDGGECDVGAFEIQ